MQIKIESPKMKQSETADQLCYSSSTLQRYTNDINKLSPYRIQPNITNKRTEKTSNTHFDINPHGKFDIKRPQTISNDVSEPETKTKSSKKNNILKAGSVHRTIEINDKYLEEVFHNNNLWMELAMQNSSNDQTVRDDTNQDLKEINSQSLTTQAKKRTTSFYDACY